MDDADEARWAQTDAQLMYNNVVAATARAEKVLANLKRDCDTLCEELIGNVRSDCDRIREELRESLVTEAQRTYDSDICRSLREEIIEDMQRECDDLRTELHEAENQWTSGGD